MTILRASFSASGALAWELVDATGDVFQSSGISAGTRDPLGELRFLEIRAGVARVEFSVTPEHPLTADERTYALACGWKLV